MSIMSQTLTLKNRVHRAFPAQPIAIGVPWPRGGVGEGTGISLRDAAGEPLPVAATVLNRWPDGSVQWTLLDFAAELAPGEEQRLTVTADGAPAPAPAYPVRVNLEGNRLTLTNGLVELELGEAGELLRRWTAAGRPVIEPGSLDLVVTGSDDTEYTVSGDASRRLSVEHATPLRAVARVDGRHTAGNGETLLHYWLKFTVTAGSPDVKISYHFRNRELPVPGISVQSIRLTAVLGVPEGAERAITQQNRGRQYLTAPVRLPEDFEIFSADTPLIDHYQALHVDGESGGVYIREGEYLRQHVEEYPWFLRKDAGDFDPNLPLKFRGIYQERCVWPYLAVAGPEQAVAVVPLNFTGMHPKSLRIEGKRLTYGIWPAWAGPLAITQGAGRTHEVVIAALPADAADFDFQTRYLSREVGIYAFAGEASDPVAVTPDIAWIRKCEVFHAHRLPEYQPDAHFRFERKLARIGYGGATGSVTSTPANGMWHFGDYAPICNNDNMASLRYLQDYLRSGNWDLAARALHACQHIIDVDYVDFSIYPYQHQGFCAHCAGHNLGAVYPSHEWISDLFIAYAISGDPELKQAALNMCENVLYWTNDPEGFAIVAADHREAGQPMINLTWAYEFNPDQRYLDACEKIVRQVYMPAAREYGRMLVPKPTRESVTYLMLYGDWACWKGLFYYWLITRDEELKEFYLRECDLRVSEAAAPTGGDPRSADVEMAAFAYYMTGDRRWIDRFARAFRMMFEASNWEWTWEHGIYYVKLAFDLGIIDDEQVRL
jgi:hypothetical protein